MMRPWPHEAGTATRPTNPGRRVRAAPASEIIAADSAGDGSWSLSEKVHPGIPWNWSKNGIFGGMAPVSKRENGRSSKESPAASLPATDEHLWRTVDRAIPSEVASQPPQATSDRMIPRNRRLGYLQLLRLVPVGGAAQWFLESRAPVRFTRQAEFIECGDCMTLWTRE